MKKLFVMFAVAGSLVACNNSSETTPSADSPVANPDSPAVIVTPPVVDSPIIKVDTPVKK